MLPSQRKSELIRLISQDGYASVAYLAGKLHVSQSTVRRDLDELTLEGRVARTHGGVELIGELLLPIDSRYSKNKPQKLEASRLASELIGDARVIFVDNSTTVSHLASFIPNGGLTVWTNGAERALSFAGAGIRVVSTGGELMEKSSAYIGGYTLDMIRRVTFDAVFFSSSGIDERGVSDWSEQETLIRRAVLEQSRRRYFLCDSSKLGHRSEYVVCPLDRLDAIVTEEGVFTPEELKARLTE